MRAFVIALDDHGRERLGTGADAGMVSPPYCSVHNLNRYFVSRLKPRTYRVYVHKNWHRCYGRADRVYDYTVKEPV